MAEFRVARVKQGHTKIRNVPIAVTPEGFWCCPSPVVFQKTLKSQNLESKPRPSSPPSKTSVQKKPNTLNERKPTPNSSRSKLLPDDQRSVTSDANETAETEWENLRHKVAIEFGEHGTSDLKVVLCGKPGFSVKMSVHKNVLVENSTFFADKLCQRQSPISCLEVGDCDDVESYVETVGLMYCKEMKHRLIKQSVSRVLRILKSNEERGRREMKSLVLKLLRENNTHLDSSGTAEMVNENIYSFCRSCMNSLLMLFRQAAEPGFVDKSLDSKGPVMRQIALQADNLLWLLEILIDRQAAEEFAHIWGSQKELATIHAKLPTVSRHLVSCITARLFVGIGRGEMLPSKDTRQLLLQTWLQPLIDDYCWLQHSCRSFDRKLVEEGIGRTILTLPLEDQQNILLSWLGSFLKAGDNCPNLQRAFEVWWRRTFIKSNVELQGSLLNSDG
ncbi:hypothetical protein Scep_000806 [Stephania cephalantha]|uniref:At3g05675-like ankyrin-like domain-containing protein n=1 Tax=Stephania cephalantha TaxID=152367 RepID=A0AAP0L9I4_9MAGN